VKKTVITLVFFCAIIFCIAFPVLAVAPIPPYAWEYVFEDTNMIFYMTPPTSHSEEYQAELIERFGEERLQIRSGLYYNTEPLVNVYYVDWFFSHRSVFFSECGTYFAHVHEPSMNGPEGGAVSFFENGLLTKHYQRGDLLYMGVFTDINISAFWENSKLRTYYQKNNALTIVTAQGNAFTFDITTGEMIREPADGLLTPIITPIIAFVLVLFTAFITVAYKHIKAK